MIFPFSFWTWKIKVAWLALWIRIKCVWSRRMWEKKGEDAISAASSWLNQWQGNSFLFYYSFYWVTSLSIIIFRTHLFQHGLTFSILYWLFSLHFLLDQVFFCFGGGMEGGRQSTKRTWKVPQRGGGGAKIDSRNGRTLCCHWHLTAIN